MSDGYEPEVKVEETLPEEIITPEEVVVEPTPEVVE